MFGDFVRVEIELHSYCNRDCPWCPNHYMERPYMEMDEGVFLSILKSLKENNFEDRITSKDKKVITLNGYSEPLSNPDLLIKRINQIHEILPKIDVSINTNGDFLSAELLTKLNLERIAIMDYDCKGLDYWKERFKELNILLVSQRDNILVGTHRNITQVVAKLEWPINFEIENRGGFLPRRIESETPVPKWRNDRKKRTAPCTEPLYFPTINSDGSVMMCCHMRSDTHKKHVLGNVHNQSLEEIFKSEKYLKIKEIFEAGDINRYPKECLHCHKDRDVYFGTLRREELKEEYEDIGTNKNSLAAKRIKRSYTKKGAKNCSEKKGTT